MSKWIDLSKQKPASKEFILFLVKDKIRYGRYKALKGKEVFSDMVADKDFEAGVTHYMPMPAMPKIKVVKPKAIKAKKIKA